MAAPYILHKGEGGGVLFKTTNFPLTVQTTSTVGRETCLCGRHGTNIFWSIITGSCGLFVQGVLFPVVLLLCDL